MLRVSPATEEPSPVRFNLAPDEIKRAVRNATLAAELDVEPAYAEELELEWAADLAFEVTRRELRDELPPDRLDLTAAERALAKAGYDLTRPEIDDAVWAGVQRAHDLDPGTCWDSSDGRAALRVLNAPNREHLGSPRVPDVSNAVMVDFNRLRVRRGRAARIATNSRSRGSRRGTSSRGQPNSDESDLADEGDGALPARGPLAVAQAGGVA